MKFSIENKMVFGYMPIIFVILVIAILSVRSLNELNSINRSIIEEDSFLVQAADKMEDTILAQESYGRRYLILGSHRILDLFWQRDKEFNELVDKVRALPYQEEIPIEQLVLLHNEFNDLYTKTDNIDSKPYSRLTIEFDEQVRNTFEEIMAHLQQMTLMGKQNQYMKMQLANIIGIRSFQITVLISTLGIILGLAVVSIITRSISKAIVKLKYATEIISEGNYTHFPKINTKDELGDLAGSFSSMALCLSKLEKIYLDSNPLTRLPGGSAIENALIKRLESDKDLVFCMLDLDNFKAYNDRYGYARGNEVIRTTARIIQSVVEEQGSKEDFVGHIGGDDFAIITNSMNHEKICKTVIKRFDEIIMGFYNEADRTRGQIVAKTRQGQVIFFPIISISIAVVTNNKEKQLNHIEIGEIAAELKEYAKSKPGSIFVTNRRKNKPDLHPAENPELRVVK